MTWRSNLKLVFGLIAVLALVLVLTVIFSQRQAQVVSVSASIEAERYPVGIDYGGTLVESFVTETDQRVNEGDVLFTLQSPSLQADLAKGLLKPETVAYTVTEDGEITLTAAVSGTVRDVTTKPGSFVQAGEVLATIEKAGSLCVVAQYELTGRDYSRIGEHAPVDLLLPNGASIAGTVSTIDVQTVNGQAETTIRVESDALADGAYNGLVEPGTPVSATLQLRDDGMLAGAIDGVSDFLRKIGM
ncbi:HlyD family efflux transporter periplasmic adaptor subunit [Salinibacterium sp. NG253]|uniref:HlyD family efflux transporter periplasmic adaptor subunit n=1 Tax=Salinibacterium sp. NG253 TaxID=2792039 RepID=UPI0018CDEC65|nr:HlyD family efflux transporter periplasmic adaptor subunit [Salinibacterium sp. NG253]MBH0115667.1 HlyD family efflux transporter periplasmic adaptor subunit [Salinibacterium sp. NG253]